MISTQAVNYTDSKVKIENGKLLKQGAADSRELNESVSARDKTLAFQILNSHKTGNAGTSKDGDLHIRFDALVSHDITYVSIIQTARAAGMKEFPVPYALTNCHNSLCAIGGTINEDDHAFGLSAAEKYGGIYVPANQAVIHQYAREALAGCGRMILGSDSHTRYGCFGTLGIGEGGGELVKQLLKQTYDITPPQVVLVWLEGAVKRGIGPHDVALALIKEVFPQGKVKNKILEFAGPGIENLPMDFRAGIDVMTTETSCLSSIWETDEVTREYFKAIGREKEFKEMKTEDGACYDALITIDLSKIESMIALPFHPSRAYTIHELQKNPREILENAQEICNSELESNVKLDLTGCINDRNEIVCQQGVIVGCAGGMFDNISEAADILNGKSIGNGYFDLSVYPSSTPVWLETSHQGISDTLMKAGAVIKPAFCGPCFGAGDTPAHNTLSIRHATRNFASREGAKPSNGQIAAVALTDARSIAATALNGGILTAATDIDYSVTVRKYSFDKSMYEHRVYNGFNKPRPAAELRLGPNITNWPEFEPLKENILIRLCAVIHDEVTTTDELIPSGETSSYRSNPIALAEHTLSRRVPEYVKMSKAVSSQHGISEAMAVLEHLGHCNENITIGSCIYAKKPGDGSAREQAASCQRVLGGRVNICREYATKRYRSNCINWGIVPFTIDNDTQFDYVTGDWLFIKNIRTSLLSGDEVFHGVIVREENIDETCKTYKDTAITLRCENLSMTEREIIAAGCLVNYYADKL